MCTIVHIVYEEDKPPPPSLQIPSKRQAETTEGRETLATNRHVQNFQIHIKNRQPVITRDNFLSG